jgi:hypothetical protein
MKFLCKKLVLLPPQIPKANETVPLVTHEQSMSIGIDFFLSTQVRVFLNVVELAGEAVCSNSKEQEESRALMWQGESTPRNLPQCAANFAQQLKV